MLNMRKIILSYILFWLQGLIIVSNSFASSFVADTSILAPSESFSAPSLITIPQLIRPYIAQISELPKTQITDTTPVTLSLQNNQPFLASTSNLAPSVAPLVVPESLSDQPLANPYIAQTTELAKTQLADATPVISELSNQPYIAPASALPPSAVPAVAQETLSDQSLGNLYISQTTELANSQPPDVTPVISELSNQPYIAPASALPTSAVPAVAQETLSDQSLGNLYISQTTELVNSQPPDVTPVISELGNQPYIAPASALPPSAVPAPTLALETLSDQSLSNPYIAQTTELANSQPPDATPANNEVNNQPPIITSAPNLAPLEVHEHSSARISDEEAAKLSAITDIERAQLTGISDEEAAKLSAITDIQRAQLTRISDEVDAKHFDRQPIEINNGKAYIVTFDGYDVDNFTCEKFTPLNLTVGEDDHIILQSNILDARKVSGLKYKILRAQTDDNTATSESTSFIYDEKNKLVSWVFDPTTDTISLSVDDGKKVFIENGVNEKLAVGLSQTVPGSDADSFKHDIVLASSEEIEEAGARLYPVTAQPSYSEQQIVSSALINISDAARLVVATRVSNVNTLVNTQRMTHAGVAAGDQDNLGGYGLWFSPFYGQAVQKAKNDEGEYKAKYYGGIIGFDTKINDSLVVGTAVSIVDTELKHKANKQGDKTKAQAFLISLYGLQELKNGWFAQADLTFGLNKIKNKEGRRTSKGLETAYANYNSKSYNSQVLLGYNYNLPHASVISPMLGLRYTQFKDGNYKEKGTSFTNLTIKREANSKLYGIAGLRIFSIFDIERGPVIPEIHAFISRNLRKKQSKMDVRLDGLSPEALSSKISQTNTHFNVGASIMIKHNLLEFSLGYDGNISKKYFGHQGTLKIRSNF